MRIWRYILDLGALLACLTIFAQPLDNRAVPRFGAQVFIEPGQTSEQIDGWFRTLATEAGTLLICINKSAAGETIALNRPVQTEEMIYATLGAGMDGSKIVLPSEGIFVARIR